MKTYYKYCVKLKSNSSLKVNDSIEGEHIETKVKRIVNNNEPITDGAPLIYTDRKDGVKAEYDIRTDRWEVAQNAMDYVSRSNTAKRLERIEKKSAETETIQATGNEPA